MEPDSRGFEKLVGEAIMGLPARVRQALDNVAFVVERRARRPERGEQAMTRDGLLLGLYDGGAAAAATLPRSAFGLAPAPLLPGKITLFRGAIETLARGDESALARLVADVVRHEVGHRLGLGEPALAVIEHVRRDRLKGG
jgi:predicted Zn-dependent protease with MMP-like domain